MIDRVRLRDELARTLRGESGSLTSAEVAQLADTDVALVERLWRSLGFPDAGDAAVFGEQDVEILRTVLASVKAGVLHEDTVMRLGRALAHTMSRLADWQVGAIVDQIGIDVDTGRYQSRLEAAVEVAQAALPGFEDVMLYAWRRQLAAAAARVEALGAVDSELLSTTMTVGFADLSRFTAVSNTLGEADLGDLVENFENQVTDVVMAGGGRVIKALGDAILFVHPQASEAVVTSLELVRHISKQPDLPSVRVGLATGSVLSRLGDVFGPPVNLAARLSDVARSNRVLVDELTAAALDKTEFETRPLPARQLRGFGDISPITVSQRRGFRAS